MGAIPDDDWLVKGQRSYLQGGCPGCHAPGGGLGLPQALAPDLRVLAQRDPSELRQILLQPRQRLAEATMWSLHDATYRGHFAENDRGHTSIEALIDFVLAVQDRTQRQRYASLWVQPRLRADQPCTDCHQNDGGATRGKPHTCAMLRGNSLLRCKRCHASRETRLQNKTGACPQVASAQPLCQTCHLRDDTAANK